MEERRATHAREPGARCPEGAQALETGTGEQTLPSLGRKKGRGTTPRPFGKGNFPEDYLRVKTRLFLNTAQAGSSLSRGRASSKRRIFSSSGQSAKLG